jgi:hypothetical protein
MAIVLLSLGIPFEIFWKLLLNDLVAWLGKELDCTCSLEVPFTNANACSKASRCTVPGDHRKVCGELST